MSTTSRRRLLGVASALAGASAVNIAAIASSKAAMPSRGRPRGDARLFRLERLHAAFLEEMRKANARGDFEAGEVACDSGVDCEKLIVACQATTLAGLAVKARVSRHMVADELPDSAPLDDARIIDSLALDIERLAAEAAS